MTTSPFKRLRLVTQKPLIIAVDFDGTLVEKNYFSEEFTEKTIWDPVTETRIKTIDIARHWKDWAHQVILWTCREDNLYPELPNFLTSTVDWCRSKGLVFEEVNREPPHNIISRKIYADHYVDDKSCDIDNIDSWDMNCWIL